MKTWKRRWFTLEGNRLNYYKAPEDIIPRGFILLENCSIRILNEKKLLFELFHQNDGFVKSHKSYVINAETHEDMMDWVNTLTKKLEKKKRSTLSYRTIDNPKEILKQGWLNKRGGRRKNWKKRWFVLTDKTLTLFYYDNEKVLSLLPTPFSLLASPSPSLHFASQFQFSPFSVFPRPHLPIILSRAFFPFVLVLISFSIYVKRGKCGKDFFWKSF